MFTVYIIQSGSTGRIYVGYTVDFEKRILRHNKELPFKKSSHTARNVGPWKLIYSEEYPMRAEAQKRERWLKSGVGREYIKKAVLRNGK